MKIKTMTLAVAVIAGIVMLFASLGNWVVPLYKYTDHLKSNYIYIYIYIYVCINSYIKTYLQV